MTDDNSRAPIHHVRHISDHAGGSDSLERTVNLVRQVTDQAPATDSLAASVSVFLLANVSLTATGEVTSPSTSAVDQTWDLVNKLTIPQLLALLEWVRERVIAALQDPRTEVYGTLVTIPLLVLVLRALRERTK